MSETLHCGCAGPGHEQTCPTIFGGLAPKPRQHITDAAAEQCTSDLLRDEAEEWCGSNGVIICTVEEWDERGNDCGHEPALNWAKEERDYLCKKILERDAQIASLHHMLLGGYGDLIRMSQRVDGTIECVLWERKPKPGINPVKNSGLLTVAEHDHRMGGG